VALFVRFQGGHLLALPCEQQRQDAFSRSDLEDALSLDERQQPRVFVRNVARRIAASFFR
jgi:hypothetical protein